MFCRKCGTSNDDNAYKCVQCGSVVQDPGAAALAEGPVPNYLAQAILTTIFCCQPPGIVAIVYAAQVNSKLSAGDRPGALDSSRKAKMWSWIAFGIGISFILLYFLMVVALGITGNLD